MEDLSLDQTVFVPATTARSGGSEDNDNVFLENDPNAPIRDVSSSPPRGTPGQQFDQFSSVMEAAQLEVTNQAKEAIGSIARNLREVEGRSLRCLERELQLQRRERMVEEREARVRNRERDLQDRRRDVPVSWSNRGFNKGGRGRVEKKPKSRWERASPPTPEERGPAPFQFPDAPFQFQPIAPPPPAPFPVPFPAFHNLPPPCPTRPAPNNYTILENKKGKRSLVFVDDFVREVGDKENFIREFMPAGPRIPLVSRMEAMERMGTKSAPVNYREVPYDYRRERNRGERRNIRRRSESDEEEVRTKPPVGRGPGGKKQRRGRYPKFPETDNCGAGRNKERRRRDDDEDPPEAARSMGMRGRCHSNVFIRQNVNVK